MLLKATRSHRLLLRFYDCHICFVFLLHIRADSKSPYKLYVNFEAIMYFCDSSFLKLFTRFENELYLTFTAF